jgi:hypothetical protein
VPFLQQKEKENAMVDIDEIRSRLVNFHKREEEAPPTFEEFHEWNIRFALEKFKAKRTHAPVTFFNFRRGDSISIMESDYRDEREKRAVFRMVRLMCMGEPMGVDMLSVINEVWIATTKSVDEVRRYGSVRETPGREDGLMVTSYTRGGGVKMTRWVVKLKKDPARNIILARDDVDTATIKSMYGQAFGFFSEERSVDEVLDEKGND